MSKQDLLEARRDRRYEYAQAKTFERMLELDEIISHITKQIVLLELSTLTGNK